MKHAAFFSLLLHSLVTVASAANWPQFRGPNQDGSTDETGLPEKFSVTPSPQLMLYDVMVPGFATAPMLSV